MESEQQTAGRPSPTYPGRPRPRTASRPAATQNGDEYEAVFTNSLALGDQRGGDVDGRLVATQPASQTADAGSASLYGGQCQPSGRHGAVGGEHRRRDDFSRHFRRHLDDLHFHDRRPENGDQYEAVFSNGAGTLTSNPATLTVDYRYVTAAGQPDSRRRRAVTFTAAFQPRSGGDTVQWQVSTDGGTTFAQSPGRPRPPTASRRRRENGNEYEAVFTNAAGTFTSNAATLTVDYAPAVTTNPASETVNAGGTATFTAAATGNPTPTRAVAGEHRRRYDLQRYHRRDLNHLSFTASTHGERQRVRGRLHQLRWHGHQHRRHVDGGPCHHPARQPRRSNAGARSTLHGGPPTRRRRYVQWQVSTDGGTTFSDISGATSTTYTFTAGRAKRQRVRGRVHQLPGTLTSGAATLTVDSPRR